MTHTFRVWAPSPVKVEVQVGRDRFPMSADTNNWWTAAGFPAYPGTDYGFVLGGQGPFPDPRSPCQPYGVDGLSRTVDHGSFPWTDANWAAPPLSAAVIYELHVGTFTAEGTFDAVIQKLDHLKRLGVTHVELMPVNEFPGERGWGYDGAALYAPHHGYGGPEGLKRLVNACHGRGLAVLLDVVYNHLGPTGNYLGRYGPYFTRHYSSPWGEGLNFDGAESGEVRRFFCDNALMWLRDYHFDGLRLDAVHAILDASATPFLEQLAIEVKKLAEQLGRTLILIPESDLNDPRILWSRERGGFGLDAQWSDDFHHALHTVLTSERNGYYADFGTFANLGEALRNAYVYKGQYSVYRRRPHGRAPAGLDGTRFLGYMQNHDQVGNRPGGERSSRLMCAGRLKIAATIVLTAPFIPMLFQGEEWGATTPFLYFTDHQNAELGQAVREGRQREFAALGLIPEEFHDPQATETFQRSKLNWLEPAQAFHADLLEWHRWLIELRRTEPSLTDGRKNRVQISFDEANRWLVIERGPFIVACNLGERQRLIPLLAGKRRILLASTPVENSAGSAILLPQDSVALMKLESGK